tara:strand:+ start:111 stop:1151 length:1041 start_codon:yes stop_codon:yes gene_type:complete
MKKLAVFVGTPVLLTIIAGAALYNTASGQDFLIDRLATLGMSKQAIDSEGLNVIVCGSASPLGNDPDRAQACIAVVTPEHFFLFDIGDRASFRIAEARLPTGRLTGIFLTHFHSDHIADVPSVNMNSWIQGRDSKLNVYGPQGVETVIGGFNIAYQLDKTYRTAHHGADLLPAATAAMNPITITPGIAFQDANIKITAFLVDHAPIDPAMGYRVDYKDRSVVISGDTVSTDSLFIAAKDADLLLHDALSEPALAAVIAAMKASGNDRTATIVSDVHDYHAHSTNLEAQSKKAGIKQLAFYHMVPVPTMPLIEKIFQRGISSDVILTKDLMTFQMLAGSEEIIITEP